MKKTLLSIALIMLSATYVSSQTYNLVSDDGTTVTTTTGTVSLGAYTPGEVYTLTLCSDDPLCSHISLTFDTWTLGSGNLCVYDGDDTAADLIGCNAWGVSSTVSATQTNSTGCLTFQFSSSAVGSDISGTIGCQFMCPDIISEVLLETDTLYKVCGAKFPLIGVDGGYDNMYWFDATHAGTEMIMTDGAHVIDTAHVDLYGDHSFYFISSNEYIVDTELITCYDTSDVVIGRFLEVPEPIAMEDDTACFGVPFIIYGVQSLDTTVVYWTTTETDIHFASTGTDVGDTLIDVVSCSTVGAWRTITLHEVITDGSCNETDDVNIYFAPSPLVQGTVQHSGGLLNENSALVNLYTQGDVGFDIVDSEYIGVDGVFEFNYVVTGDYYLQVDNINSAIYPNLLNTYYSSESLWENASEIFVQCADTVNLTIDMVEATTSTGDAQVSGVVNYVDEFGAETDPVENASIILIEEPSGIPVDFICSDNMGSYEISNISNGTYSLHCDVTGLPEISFYNFEVTSTAILFEDFDFIVDTTNSKGFGVYATNLSFINTIENSILAINAYPNPFNNQTTIEFPKTINSDCDFVIYNIIGEEVRRYSVIKTDKLQINRASLKSGIYIGKLINNKNNSIEGTVKLIVD